MTAFLSNEPEPTAGSWFRLYSTCRMSDNTQPDKISWDKATHWWLGVVTPNLFSGGKTGLVSSLSCLNYSFGFPTYSLWPSLVGWRSYLWKPDQENDPGETSSFPAPLPPLKKVQLSTCVRAIDEKRNNIDLSSCAWGWASVPWTGITNTPMDY